MPPKAATLAPARTDLIVDDEPTVRMLITEVLEGLGCAAIEVADANSALKVLQSNVRIDLLITDVGLPGSLTGLQMARIDRPDLKVLCITGYPLKVATQGGGLETTMHMLTKPFSLETLASRVEAIIGKS
jgi:CheY-like chemotaxis protein